MIFWSKWNGSYLIPKSRAVKAIQVERWGKVGKGNQLRSRKFMLYGSFGYKAVWTNFGPSEVRATSGQHLGGHYFRY
jgi:hypothetical protein